MPAIAANGIKIEYEEMGPKDGPVVLLIMGLAAQMTLWPPAMLNALTAAGFRVVRFDNRDIGLTQKLHGKRVVNPLLQIAAQQIGFGNFAPYTLHTMVSDAVGLLDALKIEHAHVVGASMGGMIAQVLAGRHADRVASLGLIMSSSGKPLSALPRWRVIRLAFDAPARDAPWEDRLAVEVRNIAVINGPHFLPPADALRSRVERLRARSDYPQGMLRQFDAILGTGSLLRYTKRITAPTVVIHGSDDPMVRPRNGRSLARAIPGARFVVVDGMGHDLPEPVWRPIVETLTENVTSG